MVAENAVWGTSRVPWTRRVACAAIHEKYQHLCENNHRMLQIACEDDSAVDWTELLQKRQVRQELRQERRNEKLAEEVRVALQRFQHGRQLKEDLMSYVRACTTVELRVVVDEVTVQDADEVQDAEEVRELRSLSVRKRKEHDFFLTTAQFGYGPGYGKRYIAKNRRFRSNVSGVVYPVVWTKVVREAGGRARVLRESHFRPVRVNLPRHVYRSRRVGCKRVVRARHSPGCGVNRRRRRSPSLSEFRLNVFHDYPVLDKVLCVRFAVVCSLCFPLQQAPSVIGAAMRDAAPLAESGQLLFVLPATSRIWIGRGRDRCASRARFAGALRGHDAWSESCGSFLGRWRGKCLQKVIIECCEASQRTRAERWFRKKCQNNWGSGCGGNSIEVQNFLAVTSFLLVEGVHVRVVSAPSRKEFEVGVFSGVWQLGNASGACLGGVVWYEADRHVAKLRGSVNDLLQNTWSCVGDRRPPWSRLVVGAPKGRPMGQKNKKLGRPRQAMNASLVSHEDVSVGASSSGLLAGASVVEAGPTDLTGAVPVESVGDVMSPLGADDSVDEVAFGDTRLPLADALTRSHDVDDVSEEAFGDGGTLSDRGGGGNACQHHFSDSSEDRALADNGGGGSAHHRRFSDFSEDRALANKGGGGSAHHHCFSDSSEDCGRDAEVSAGFAPAAKNVSRRLQSCRQQAILERRREESRVFQPDEVDPDVCQALKTAKVQCRSAKVCGTDFCRTHQRKQFYGTVRGALSRRSFVMLPCV